jgi:SlyX protein
METRLINLETRITFQEDSIETLSMVLAKQQDQIDKLILQVDSLTKLVKQLYEDKQSDLEEGL